MKDDTKPKDKLQSEGRKIRGPLFGKQYIQIVDGIVRMYDGYDDCLVYEQPMDHAEFMAWAILEEIAQATGVPISIPVYSD